MLTTQVSSVRDEPTPIHSPQAQSPVRSAEPSPAPDKGQASGPAPGPTLSDGPAVSTDPASDGDRDGGAVADEAAKDADRAELSRLLFEHMLKQVDTPPPPPGDPSVKQENEQPQRSSSIKAGRPAVNDEYEIRTSEFVKKGLIPLNLAYEAMTQSMKNERGADEDGLAEAGGVAEFSLVGHLS